jgi:hypothetical protein
MDGGKTMKPIVDILRSDWKIRFLFLSMVVCMGLIIVMMVMLVKII